jgi:hypothetical protein
LLEYIADAFDERYGKLEADEYVDLEDRDEYMAESIFYVIIDFLYPSIENRSKNF